MDARPSDAISLALRARAPVFLNRLLLRQWPVSVAEVEADARGGRCRLLRVSDEAKSARSMREEVRRRPEVLQLATLKMRLDLAVRTERFAEAAKLEEDIRRLCPIDYLKTQLDRAVEEERYSDAVRLQDEITVWKARLRMWERGMIDSDDSYMEKE